jgi:hypothetical protein
MNGYFGANYNNRCFDLSVVLHALGSQWESSPNDATAQDAANLYYRLKGTFVTEYYQRKG